MPEPQPGDLLLFYGGRRLGWWIERVTRSPFYHVALYDRDGYVVDAVPRGVVRRRVDDGTTGTRFVIARAPAGSGEAALAWARTQIGRPFDALGMTVVLASLALGRRDLPYQPTRRFTCAHLVTEAFRHAGIDLVPGRTSALVTPADLAHETAAWGPHRRDAEDAEVAEREEGETGRQGDTETRRHGGRTGRLLVSLSPCLLVSPSAPSATSAPSASLR